MKQYFGLRFLKFFVKIKKNLTFAILILQQKDCFYKYIHHAENCSFRTH